MTTMAPLAASASQQRLLLYPAPCQAERSCLGTITDLYAPGCLDCLHYSACTSHSRQLAALRSFFRDPVRPDLTAMTPRQRHEYSQRSMSQRNSLAAKMRAYYEQHKDELAAKMRAYREQHKEQCRAACRKWWAAHHLEQEREGKGRVTA